MVESAVEPVLQYVRISNPKICPWTGMLHYNCWKLCAILENVIFVIELAIWLIYASREF